MGKLAVGWPSETSVLITLALALGTADQRKGRMLTQVRYGPDAILENTEAKGCVLAAITLISKINTKIIVRLSLALKCLC